MIRRLKLAKAIVWNKTIKLWWYRLWIRGDEFHVSLDIDNIAMSVMTEKERREYIEDLAIRRNIAHKRQGFY